MAKAMRISGQMDVFQCLGLVFEPVRTSGCCTVQEPLEGQEANAAISDEIAKKIKVYGKGRNASKTEAFIRSLPLTGDEGKDRLVIQQALDAHTGMATVLYDGNTVYPSKKLVSELKRMIRTNSLARMSSAMYQFLSLNFDIAHYDKQGFIDYYDGIWGNFVHEALAHTILRIPRWETDVQKIMTDAGILQ